MKHEQNYINHIALVLDASSSMRPMKREVIAVADNLIAHLAQRSKELDQETRITVYTFASSAKCVIYDKDVLRLPSIRDYYQPGGWTALIDATILSQEDLRLTPQKYGDHAFLTYVLTDGEENESRKHNAADLQRLLAGLRENETVAVLVPDQGSVFEAKRFGFPKDNIAVWDATSTQGVAEVGETIRRATDAYMTSRAQGVRSTRFLFSTGPDAVNKQTVTSSLDLVDPSRYTLVRVLTQMPIRDFVEANGQTFRLGTHYYQLTKREEIQPQKSVYVLEKKTGRLYGGAKARELIHLPDMTVKVNPETNPDYTVFVQSTSWNRNLVPGTELLTVR